MALDTHTYTLPSSVEARTLRGDWTLLYEPTFSVDDDRTAHLLMQAASIGVGQLEDSSMDTATACVSNVEYVKRVFEVFASCDTVFKHVKQELGTSLVTTQTTDCTQGKRRQCHCQQSCTHALHLVKERTMEHTHYLRREGDFSNMQQ